MPWVPSPCMARSVSMAWFCWACSRAGIPPFWARRPRPSAWSGYPALLGEAAPTISLVGQIVGVVVFVAIGLITGYVSSLILKMAGMLGVPGAAKRAGLDSAKVPAQAYPEGISASPPASI